MSKLLAAALAVGMIWAAAQENQAATHITADDMVIIPTNSPYGFSEITEAITYIVVRVDPDQLVALK